MDIVGLLVKQMLSMSHSDPVYHPVLDRSEGLVFYSVPHHGSPLAVLGKHTKYLFYPSVEVTELTEGKYIIEVILEVKTSLLHLDSNQGRQIAGLNFLPLSYRVRQVFTAYVRFCSERVATSSSFLDSVFRFRLITPSTYSTHNNQRTFVLSYFFKKSVTIISKWLQQSALYILTVTHF